MFYDKLHKSAYVNSMWPMFITQLVDFVEIRYIPKFVLFSRVQAMVQQHTANVCSPANSRPM